MATSNSVVPLDLNTQKIRSKTFKEIMRGNEFASFISKDANGVIQLEVDSRKGAGTNLTFSLLAAQDPSTGFIEGDNEQNGNEEKLTYYSDKVEINDLRRAILVGREKYDNLKTPMELQGVIKPQLMDVFAERLASDIAKAAEVTATPNRARVLFGADDANFNSTLDTALGSIDSSTDKLSVKMIKTAVAKAKNIPTASANVKARKIRPFKASADKFGSEVNNFLLFVDPIASQHLTADSDWKDLRAADRNNEISKHFFTGSEYLGTVHGVMCFEVPRLAELTKAGKGDSGINVLHSILVGAQAFGLAYGLTGKFNYKSDTDYGMNVGINYHQIYGIKMLKFNSIEQGVVHIFSAAK